MAMIRKCVSSYRDADEFVTVNDNDPDLKPITLKLPSPPELKLIDGYGLPIKDQKFKRLVIPEGLKRIEKQAMEELTAECRTNKNNIITLYKIQKRFWSILEKDYKKYDLEIAFIRKFWWHRLNGYWFYNFGKPTYITGWHFFYLNVWTMSTDDGTGRPEYRDRDRKEFLFKHYAYTTTETFKNVDEYGNAIPNEDGSYDMIDLGHRICFGVGQSKNRRSGNTNKGLSDCTEIVTRSEMTDGMFIFSHTGDDAEDHFKSKMLPAFDKFPIWLKPLCTSGRSSTEIKFEPEKNDYTSEGLQTKIAPASTGGDKAVDGKKVISVLMDESGKVVMYDVSKRWKVIKNCLAQGNGRLIHGWSYHPSTVEEMTEGGAEYRILLEASNFYQRLPSGQTKSGLFRLFVPADEALDGFIDPYGMSIKDKIEDYQYELGFTQTANDYLQGELDSLLKDGSPEAMRAYRHQKKLFPLKYMDSWHGGTGDLGFPLEKIDQRQAELRRNSNIKVGNLKWVNNEFGGDVCFQEDWENGRFEVSSFPPQAIANQRTPIDFYSVFEKGVIRMYQPRFPKRFVIGADPYKFRNKQDNLRSRMAKGVTESNLSRGGLAGLLCKTEEDDEKEMKDWVGYNFHFSYCHRSNSDDFNEDCLKAAIFWGGMVYPEANIGNVEEYFIRNCFGGYLIYDIDQRTGHKKPFAGLQNIDRTKQQLFQQTKEYLDYRVQYENHSSYLSECSSIRNIEDLTVYDRLASHGLALLGAQSLYPSRMIVEEEQGSGLDEYLEWYSL